MTPQACVKFHSAAASALRDQGIDTMFGVMGDANMFIADSFATRWAVDSCRRRTRAARF